MATFAVVLVFLSCLITFVIDEIKIKNIGDVFDAGSQAFAKYLKLSDLLDEWRAARPLLFVRECDYATGLVIEMIEAYSTYIRCRGTDARREANLRGLYLLLRQFPPHTPPPGLASRGLLPGS